MKFQRVLLRALLVVTFCGAAWAQDTGSITGTVKDPTGAAVPGAAVEVSSSDHGIDRQTVTNSSGDYNESGLPGGTYDVKVTATGFKKYQAKGVKLDVAQKARVDIPLEVGASTTEVTVEGSNVAQVETQSSDLGGTVNGKEISQLGLNGRNFTQLVTLTPGVSNQTGQDEGTVGVYGNVSYSMNGGRVEYNNWELDGGDNMDNGSNSTLNVYPSLDAIAEFKVLTSNYGAQYGRNGSGTVEVETKSGTNNSTVAFTNTSAMMLSIRLLGSKAESCRNTRRTTTATMLAAQLTSRASTTKTRRRLSSSGPRNGAKILCRDRLSTCPFPAQQTVPETLAICVRKLTLRSPDGLIPAIRFLALLRTAQVPQPAFPTATATQLLIPTSPTAT